MDFRIPAKNFAGKILAFLYYCIHAANFFQFFPIYIAENKKIFQINMHKKNLSSRRIFL